MAAEHVSENALYVEDIYYINTNEIPGELSRENISSHVKITCYLHM